MWQSISEMSVSVKSRLYVCVCVCMCRLYVIEMSDLWLGVEIWAARDGRGPGMAGGGVK